MATEILHSDPALAAHAAEIRRLSKQTMENIVEIGRRLSECRAIFKKNGEWGAWLKDEFDWSDQTARRFIHVYEQLPGLNKLLSRKFPISALYLLAAPSTPPEARDQIIEQAKAGEAVSVAEVKHTIETAKGRQQPAKKTTKAVRKPKFAPDGELVLSCSFCFKSNVDTLFTGVGQLKPVYICNECVDECASLIKQKKAATASREAAPPPPESGDGLDIPGFLDRTKGPLAGRAGTAP
jgi:hypothetical protein